MSERTTDSRGRRYSDRERSEILAYVDKINSLQGKGGQIAAQRKYSLSALTLKNWLRSRSASALVSGDEGSDIHQMLGRMRIVAIRIEKLERELAEAREEMEKLKRNLPSLRE